MCQKRRACYLTVADSQQSTTASVGQQLSCATCSPLHAWHRTRHDLNVRPALVSSPAFSDETSLCARGAEPESLSAKEGLSHAAHTNSSTWLAQPNTCILLSTRDPFTV